MDANLLARYKSTTGASAYRRKYERSWIRRLSNRRELAIVKKALLRAGTSGRVLDCPCGAGRLVPTLLGVADHVTAVDISDAMVGEARDALAPLADTGKVDFAVAGADALPFDDNAFDTAVCHRLIHHMETPEERARVFSEFARVARGHFITTFSDATTWKAKSQNRRGVTRRRYTLTPDELFAEVAPHGLTPVGTPLHLNAFSSLVAVQVFAVQA